MKIYNDNSEESKVFLLLSKYIDFLEYLKVIRKTELTEEKLIDIVNSFSIIIDDDEIINALKECRNDVHSLWESKKAQICKNCNGTGWWADEDEVAFVCNDCKGTGRV